MYNTLVIPIGIDVIINVNQPTVALVYNQLNILAIHFVNVSIHRPNVTALPQNQYVPTIAIFVPEYLTT